MSEKSPTKYPAIVYQHRIQILANGEALVAAGKARLATANDAALSGQSVDKDALQIAADLQVKLDEASAAKAEAKVKAAEKAAIKAKEKAEAQAVAAQAAAEADAKKKQG